VAISGGVGYESPLARAIAFAVQAAGAPRALGHDLDRQLARLAYASVGDHTQLSGGDVLAAEEQADARADRPHQFCFPAMLDGEVEWRTDRETRDLGNHRGD
jgi:hypothetical protein